MGKRDLKADLELCNKATSGPWIEGTDLSEVIIQNAEGEEVLLAVWYDNVKWVGIREENLNLFLQAREGWPHAIERAIKAELLVRELTDTLDANVWVLHVNIETDESEQARRNIEYTLNLIKEVLGDE